MFEFMPTVFTKIRMTLPSALIFAILSAPLAPNAYAAGDENDEPTCRKGLVWDKKKQMCIPAKAGVLSDDALADYAYALSSKERFQDALDVLDLATDQKNAKVLNYRGYATRKLGRLDEGIRYYHQALAIDPENVLVRSYLGEAYLRKGNAGKARILLDEIRDRCGTGCKAFIDLAAAIQNQANG